jgi:hypothetical protein
MTVIKNSFRLWLELTFTADDGTETTEKYDLAQMMAGFAVNKIPVATCVLAVGRNVDTLEAAKIHTTAEGLKLMLPAKVWLDARGSWDGSNDISWTSVGPQVIFEGYLTGTGFGSAQGNLGYTVQLIHWLSDLAFSSALSNKSHPSNPADITFPDSYSPPCAEIATASRNAFTSGDRFYTFFKEDDITEDFWGRSLHPLLCCLASEDAMRMGACSDESDTSEPIPNQQSLDALARFESDTSKSCGTSRFWSDPVRLGGGIVGQALASGISKFFGKQQMESYWNVTMWDKLVQEFLPTFKLALIPLVSTAMVVPYMPGLRSTWRKSILVDEWDEAEISSFIRRPLRGVGIYAGREFRTASSSRQTAGLYGSLGSGGCFIPDPEAKGQILIQKAPGWLVNVPGAASDPGLTTTGARSDTSGEADQTPSSTNAASKRATSTATTPVTAEDVAGGTLRPAADPVEVMKETGSLYASLARWVYVTEALRGRTGLIKTNFRMDIAPGSTISVGFTGDRFVAKDDQPDQLNTPVIATVSRVGIQIDAEGGQAATTFHLQNVRTLQENQDDRTSAPVHPLYPDSVQFTGAPLVDAYLFE